MLALVTDAHLRNSLAGIRGLGQAGVRVAAAGPRRGAAGLWSRHAAERRVVPEPGEDAGPLLALIAELAPRGVVVYPGQETTIDALLAAREPLPEGALLPYGSLEGLLRLRDKRALEALADEVGLGAPTTLAEATAGELSASSLPVPCVVKPALPGGALPTATVVAGREELDALLGGLEPSEPLLVQERAEGPLGALALVLGPEGELVARFQQEARRTWPPDAGISSLAVSVAPDEDLVARAAELLRRAGHAGLAQLQFVGSGAKRALIDVNPRFYGSLPLAIAAGANLPAAWHASVTGAPRLQPGGYRVGVSYRWLFGDLMSARHGAPRRLLSRAPRPRVGAAWRADDPLPGVLLGAELAGVSMTKRLPLADR